MLGSTKTEKPICHAFYDQAHEQNSKVVTHPRGAVGLRENVTLT